MHKYAKGLNYCYHDTESTSNRKLNILLLWTDD